MAEPTPRRTPSGNVRRARQLLAGGAVGGAAATAIVTAVFAALGGAPAAASALLAAGVTLAFFVVGQGVQAVVADAPPVVVMVVALASYLGRVVGLGVLGWFVLANPGRWSGLDPRAVVFGTITVVVGWLVAEFWVFSRLRIPVFDEPPE